MMKKIFILSAFLLIVFGINALAITIYVSPSGNDKNPGTKQKPLLSFAKAQMIAKDYAQKESVVVIFENGTYYLPQTIVFTPQDNPGNRNITYKAAEEGKAVISGGSLLNLTWKPFQNGIYVAQIEGNPDIDQLYVNGVRQRMARFPNVVGNKNVFDTWELSHKTKPDTATNPLYAERVKKWNNPSGGYLHAMHNLLWGDMHWLIKGKKNDTTLLYEGGWQNNRPSAMHGLYRMAENIFEELDAPNEWFYNAATKQIFFMPDAKTNLATAKVEIVRLKSLIQFQGTPNKPVKNVHLQGLVFRHTARTFMENKEPLLRSDWTVYRGGAIYLNGAEDCSIQDCEFDQVGGNTIFVNNYNRRIAVKGCYIHHSGASGVVFVGDPAAVRSPLFRYGNQKYATIDRTAGPKSNNFPEDCLVENCLITLTGREEKQTAPIHISISHKIRINHCSIYDVPRAGININEGTFGGHIIENCDIFNTVLETGDHGSFNSWGRDRYWTPDINETCREVEKDSTMPFWDMLAPNIIRHNRWRCDHGWDIDLDDGSTNYLIYNNLLLNRGLKLREGYKRIVTNNIIINSSLHPHVWYRNSGDVFKHNIVFAPYQPAIMTSAIAPDGKWGKEIDSNFFATSKSAMTKFAKNGCDEHSLFGDPMFVDASTGNFQVSNPSPARTIGFTNFPLNKFGVVKPSLKAIAKTPVLPKLNIQLNTTTAVQTSKQFSWLGVPLREPKGEEMSAFGVGFDEGGVLLTLVNVQSDAARLGFRTGDLIQEMNGTSIKNIQQLQTLLRNPNTSNTTVVTVVRNQVKQQITIKTSFSKVIE